MSALLYVLLSALASTALAQSDKKDVEVNFQKWNETCSKELGGVLTLPMEHKDMKKEVKCYLACIMEKDGMMNKDGSIKVDDAEDSYLVYKWQEHIPKEKILGFIRDCFKEVLLTSTNDKCENAYNYSKCISDKQKRGKNN